MQNSNQERELILRNTSLKEEEHDLSFIKNEICGSGIKNMVVTLKHEPELTTFDEDERINYIQSNYDKLMILKEENINTIIANNKYPFVV